MKQVKEIDKNEAKEIYFIILYKGKKISEKKEKIIFKKNQTPKCIYTKKNETKQHLEYINIFKYTLINVKKDNHINLEFLFENEDYSIYFDFRVPKESQDKEEKVKKAYFIFEVTLIKEIPFYKTKSQVEQNIISLDEKMNYFIESLNEEKEKIEDLYKDSINLYSKKKGFGFLMNIFIKVYENKNLCNLLLNEFNKVSNKIEPEKINLKKDLEKYKDMINKIYENSEKLISDNSFNSIDFYGIILCYLNNYETENYTSLINKLYEKDKKILFSIMLKFSPYFKNEIKMDFKLLDEFINYCTTIEFENFDVFIKKGLIYLKDIKTFLKIINNNKEKKF